jgi:hypothetical protein
MFNYLSEIKKRDEASKQRFVVIGTAISFVAIIGVWVPIRIAQWKTHGDAVVAKTENVAPVVTSIPTVAGDEAVRVLLGGSTEKTTATPVVSSKPLFANPVVTATPVVSGQFVPENSISEVAPEATPTSTDFPTL